MSLTRRNVTRTVKNSTETTTATDSPSSTTTPFALQTTDKFYVGLRNPFACRYFQLAGTANVQSLAVAVKYWNGTEFVAVEDLVDQTIGFTTSGFISWVNPGGWKKKALSPITDLELYWIEVSVSANMTAGATLQSVLNLFSDDAHVRVHYPELISDSRYLPPDRTDYLEQHVAARDLVVRRLKADGVIKDESQLIDPNEVALAAVHAFAYVLLNPISRSEEDRARAKAALDDMGMELSKVRLDIDQNQDGIIEEIEEETGNSFRKRG